MKKKISRIVQEALDLHNKAKVKTPSSSLVSSDGIEAVFRTDVARSNTFFESTSRVVNKPISRNRWLAKLPE